MSRQADLDRFYGLLDELRRKVGGFRYLADADEYSGWPKQGVYFFFERGEARADGTELRVVRVGTHGAGAWSTLWGRLIEHKGHASSTRGGGGNHRSSVFRRAVGATLLQRGNYPATVLATWGRGRVSLIERAAERPLEQEVSTIIHSMPFLWVTVADAASTRKVIEAGAIGLLSNWGRPAIDPASPGWLGCHCPAAAVAESGLWNVKQVDEQYDPGFLDVLAEAVSTMGVGSGE